MKLVDFPSVDEGTQDSGAAFDQEIGHAAAAQLDQKSFERWSALVCEAKDFATERFQGVDTFRWNISGNN